MSGGKQPATAKGKSSGPSALVWVIIAVAVGVPCAIGVVTSSGDSGTSVTAPATDERADTVPLLQEASASQGICYGWRLRDYYRDVSVGSNLGDGTPVDDPSCPRWIEVRADVDYVPESSESNDSASVRVNGSPDIDRAALDTIELGLARFGLDSGAFIDDPGWAITRAATVLPLLAGEAGLAEPLAAPSTDPTASPSPLPDAGNDFWRDRWGWLLATAGLLLLAALFITVGVVQRRRQRRVVVPAQRAGAGVAGRTRGRA